MTAAQGNNIPNSMTVAFSGLPQRTLERLSCTHSLSGKKLRVCCEQLNVLNIAETAPMLAILYQELAAVRLGLHDIYELYLITKPTLNRVHEAARNIYGQKRLQLSTEARRAVSLSHTLDRAVILALKALLVDAIKVPKDGKIDLLTSMIATQIFVHLGEIYLRLNEFSMPIAPGFWRECNGLFWITRQRGVDALQFVQNDYPAYPPKLSIAMVFKALVLYSMLEPFRYDRLLQAELWQLTLRFAPEVELSSSPIEGETFALVLTEDLSHVPVRALDKIRREDVLYLGAAKLILRMRHNKGSFTENRRLESQFENFAGFFSQERFRQQQRSGFQESVSGYFGLLHIFSAVQDGSKLQFSGSADDDIDENNSEEEINYGLQESAAVQAEELLIKDKSEGGFCLETAHQHRLVHEAGDLVFLVGAKTQAFCVIRWTRSKPDGLYTMGIEKISDKVSGVKFAIANTDGSRGAFEKALRLDSAAGMTLFSRLAVSQGQNIIMRENKVLNHYQVTEAHWLVSGYVKILLEPALS